MSVSHLKKKLACSLVITVRNDAEALQRLLDALDQQTVTPHETIITVADSDDATLSVAESWQPNWRVKVLSVGTATRSEGRNRGLELARSEILVTTDAGCVPEPHWLEHLIQPFTHPQVKLISGMTLGELHTPWEEAQIPYVLVAPDKIGAHPLPATRNWAVRKSAWESVGPFRADLQWAEDYEWARRAAASGVYSTFAREAIVRWKPRATGLAFFTMIHLLTLGDTQAQTWRFGHFTMWARYAFFFATLLFFWSFLPFRTAFVALLIIWFLYAGAKAWKFSFQSWQAYVWIPYLQFLADSGVLTGTARGIVQKVMQRGK